jgi:hypothetical protein
VKQEPSGSRLHGSIINEMIKDKHFSNNLEFLATVSGCEYNLRNVNIYVKIFQLFVLMYRFSTLLVCQFGNFQRLEQVVTLTKA